MRPTVAACPPRPRPRRWCSKVPAGWCSATCPSRGSDMTTGCCGWRPAACAARTTSNTAVTCRAASPSCPATRSSASSRPSVTLPPGAGASSRATGLPSRSSSRAGDARHAAPASTGGAPRTAWATCTGSWPSAGSRWAVTVPGTSAGQVVAVLGPGIRGLCACAAAKQAGAAFVMVTGKGARDATRLALAPHFGADLAVDVDEQHPTEALRAATGVLADVVVDVTAKAPAALAQAIDLARPGGTVVLAGTRASAETPGFWPDLIVYKELRILGALGVDAPAYAAALDLLAAGTYPFAELPRRCSDLAGAAELLEAMSGATDEQPAVHNVVVPWQEAGT